MTAFWFLLGAVMGSVISPLAILFIFFRASDPSKLHVCPGHPNQPLFPEYSRRPGMVRWHR